MCTVFLLRFVCFCYTITANKDLRFPLEGVDDTGSLIVLKYVDEAALSEMIYRRVRPVATHVAGALNL